MILTPPDALGIITVSGLLAYHAVRWIRLVVRL